MSKGSLARVPCAAACRVGWADAAPRGIAGCQRRQIRRTIPDAGTCWAPVRCGRARPGETGRSGAGRSRHKRQRLPAPIAAPVSLVIAPAAYAAVAGSGGPNALGRRRCSPAGGVAESDNCGSAAASTCFGDAGSPGFGRTSGGAAVMGRVVGIALGYDDRIDPGQRQRSRRQRFQPIGYHTTAFPGVAISLSPGRLFPGLQPCPGGPRPREWPAVVHQSFQSLS